MYVHVTLRLPCGRAERKVSFFVIALKHLTKLAKGRRISQCGSSARLHNCSVCVSAADYRPWRPSPNPGVAGVLAFSVLAPLPTHTHPARVDSLAALQPDAA